MLVPQMAKKRKAAKAEASPATTTPNNPFGALSDLRDALPSAPAAKQRETPAATAGPTLETAAKGGKLVVRREKKGRGGKTITRIGGLAKSELAPLAKKMKKALGCGATVEGDDIVLLGSLVERAATWLEGRGAKRVVRSN